jgi:hypothetical protein
MQKLLTTFALLIGITSFSGCGSLPTKPSIDSGIVIVETNEAFFVNNQTSEEFSLDLVQECLINPELNKYILHSNKDWNKVMLYIRLLENAVPKKIRKQLKKVRKSTKILNKKSGENVI